MSKVKVAAGIVLLIAASSLANAPLISLTTAQVWAAGVIAIIGSLIGGFVLSHGSVRRVSETRRPGCPDCGKLLTHVNDIIASGGRGERDVLVPIYKCRSCARIDGFPRIYHEGPDGRIHPGDPSENY